MKASTSGRRQTRLGQISSSTTSRVSHDFYIFAVAGEIKQMKPNIWKLQVRKWFVSILNKCALLHGSS